MSFEAGVSKDRDLKAKLDKLKRDKIYLLKQIDNLENFQKQREERYINVNAENTALENKLAIIHTILAMNKYLNKNIIEDNLTEAINDTLVGILGVVSSEIIIFEKSPNLADSDDDILVAIYEECRKNKYIVINNKLGLYKNKNKNFIKSIMGVPIHGSQGIMGALILKHSYYNFFNEHHKEDDGNVNLIDVGLAAANQIGILIEIHMLYRKVKETSVTDPLMQISTRGNFFKIVSDKLMQNESCAIIMVDIDKFKAVNDTYGHLAGDKVLSTIASKIIKANLNKGELAGRYGGEEIIIYMDGTKEEIIERVESLRRTIEDYDIESGSNIINVTASFGISFSSLQGNDLISLIESADKRLYKAKNNGRNQVVAFEEEDKDLFYI